MSSEVKDFNYIQFPLCLQMLTYDDPHRGFNIILDYGIVRYAMKFDYDIIEVGRQLMYCYYRKTEMLQNSLYVSIDRYSENDQLTIDTDYNGFSGTDFDPLETSEELLDLFETDAEFKAGAILNYQIRQAESLLNIKDYGIDNTIKNYKKGLAFQKEFESKFGPDVMPMVKTTQIIEFRDSGKDLDLFRAYIAIKSMIGMRNFATSQKPAILSRMIGCKSKVAFEYYTKNKYGKNAHLLPTVEKYSKKYHIDKLLLTLVEQKFIMYLSKPKVSVIYLSKYMEPEDLGKLIKETKEKQNLKQRIKEASKYL